MWGCYRVSCGEASVAGVGWSVAGVVTVVVARVAGLDL